MAEYLLPDVGEGLTEAEIVTWRVAVGDTVAVNDVVVEIETAKSLVELPSPYAGTVAALLVDEGTTVPVGTPILRITEPGEAPAEPAGPAEPSAEGRAEAGDAGGAVGSAPEAAEHDDGPATLVGYGPRAAATRRRARQAAPAAAPTAASAAAPAMGMPADGRDQPVAPRPPAGARPLAKPPVRLVARQLGVDLNSVAHAGPVITRADVEAAAVPAARELPPLGDRESREPVKGVRKAMAQAMVASAFTAPHVTEWMEVDATGTLDRVARLRRDPAYDGVHVTSTLVVAQACLHALRQVPELNARWDEEAVTFRRYVNLGLAAATPRGLLVPNIKDAADLSGPELARAIEQLVATAREGRTQPAEQVGGTFTITNVGVFGVDGGTPILNPGESGILAVGAIRKKPWVVTGADGQDALAIRQVVTIALSFDHRLVDGEKGSLFLRDVARVLEDPAAALD